MTVPANLVRLLEAVADGDAPLVEALIEHVDQTDPARCPTCSRWPGQVWECARCSDADSQQAA